MISGSSDEKENALHNLTMVLSRRSDAVLFSGSPLIRMVAPLMVDTQARSMGVRHGAVGVLKNMSLISPEACDEMVRQDVMTPLCALLSQHYADPARDLKEDPKKSPGLARKEAAADQDLAEFESEDTKAEILVQAVNLLWNLCEASETALDIAER